MPSMLMLGPLLVSPAHEFQTSVAIVEQSATAPPSAAETPQGTLRVVRICNPLAEAVVCCWRDRSGRLFQALLIAETVLAQVETLLRRKSAEAIVAR
jgi:hypothetical protein